MKKSIRRSSAAVLIAAVVSLASFLYAATAHAQIPVTNNTGCTINLSLMDCAGVVVGPFLIPGGGGPIVIPTPAGFVPCFVRDVAGAWRPFIWPPPVVNPAHPWPPPAPGSGCTGCIRLPAPGIVPPFCCGDVCWDPVARTITIWPCIGC
jgi:hypothetical protein